MRVFSHHPRRLNATRFAVTAALASALLAIPAQSQTATNTQTAKHWAYSCEQSKDTKQKLCRITQNLVIAKGDKRQRLLTLVVRPDPNSTNYSLLVALPHGLFLPAGAEIAIDNNKPIKLPIQTSDPRGAYTGTPISAELLADMKKGNNLKVTFMTVAKKAVSVPVTLSGFSASYDKLTGSN